MALRLYMDVHIPMAITRQLRLRGVDVVTATEEHTNELADNVLLELGREQGRVIFTHDIRFKALADRKLHPFYANKIREKHALWV
jgi:predicted nuclease of predicted toxin-antitoxin system